MNQFLKQSFSLKQIVSAGVVTIASISIGMFLINQKSEETINEGDVLQRLDDEIFMSTTGKEWQKAGMIPK